MCAEVAARGRRTRRSRRAPGRAGARRARRAARARAAASATAGDARGCASASAAPPSSPDTQMSSPGRAPARYSATPDGTSPSAVTLMVSSGPRVVSPPTRSTPWRSASAKKPRANAASQASSTAGSASASVAQRGAAPIAARSERFTASALWPSARGSAPGRKCRPSTSMSVVTASSRPASGRSSAQSSPIADQRTLRRAGRSSGG